MTQGVMTPPNPPSSPSTASLSGAARVGIATLIFRYFLRYFSSTHRTDLSRFRGFQSFDPVGFAIFAIPHQFQMERKQAVAPLIVVAIEPPRQVVAVSFFIIDRGRHQRRRRVSSVVAHIGEPPPCGSCLRHTGAC